MGFIDMPSVINENNVQLKGAVNPNDKNPFNIRGAAGTCNKCGIGGFDMRALSSWAMSRAVERILDIGSRATCISLSMVASRFSSESEFITRVPVSAMP